MKILLTGASGLLGKRLLQTAPDKHRLIPTHYNNAVDIAGDYKLDITDNKAVQTLVNKIKPQIIIHTASIGDVDYCESHPRLAYTVNVTGTVNLLKAAATVNSRFIFFSSNAVFDGNNPPYTESSAFNPLNVYGQTKAEAETEIRNRLPQAIIFRLNTMYGWNYPQSRDNPATWLLKRLKKHTSTSLVTDVYNNHLWVGQAASAVWKALKLKIQGETIHVAGTDCISRYEFGERICEVFGYNKKLLQPVKSNYFAKLAPRSKYNCFDTNKMVGMLDIKPLTLAQGLKFMLQQKK